MKIRNRENGKQNFGQFGWLKSNGTQINPTLCAHADASFYNGKGEQNKHTKISKVAPAHKIAMVKIAANEINEPPTGNTKQLFFKKERIRISWVIGGAKNKQQANDGEYKRDGKTYPIKTAKMVFVNHRFFLPFLVT